MNIDKAIGDSIIDQMATFGYELYAHENQVLIRPLNQAADAPPPRALPADLMNWPNKRGSVLIALKARAAAAKAVVTHAAPVVEPIVPVINTPGFGDAAGTVTETPVAPEQKLVNDPILRANASADFGTAS